MVLEALKTILRAYLNVEFNMVMELIHDHVDLDVHLDPQDGLKSP